MEPMTRKEMMLDTAGWILEEDAKAEKSGEGWDDTVDMASAGIDLANMVKEFFAEIDDTPGIRFSPTKRKI